MASFAPIVGERHARAGGPADAVDGLLPTAVVEPGSVEEVAACMKLATARGLKVLVRGGRTKLGWGRPPAGIDLVLCTTRLDRILEHAAGDLVLQAQAGARLTEVQERLAPAGQWLGLDPPPPAATLGGIVAANASGPRRLRFGTARDLLIGITVVLADGTVARAGGKVVKNVAGYDLGKLFTGSLGTLGVIVEVTFRLHPRPPARGTVDLEPGSPEEAGAAVQSLLHSVLVPSAVELHWREDCGRLTVLFEGGPSAVESQAQSAASLLAPHGPPAVVDLDGGATVSPSVAAPRDLDLKITTLPTDLPFVIREAARVGASLALRPHLRGHAASGVLFLALSGGDDDARAEAVAAFRRAVAPRGGSVVVLQASPALKRRVDVWGPAGDGLELMRRVKRQFDPHSTLAPGRFVGGI